MEQYSYWNLYHLRVSFDITTVDGQVVAFAYHPWSECNVQFQELVSRIQSDRESQRCGLYKRIVCYTLWQPGRSGRGMRLCRGQEVLYACWTLSQYNHWSKPYLYSSMLVTEISMRPCRFEYPVGSKFSQNKFHEYQWFSRVQLPMFRWLKKSTDTIQRSSSIMWIRGSSQTLKSRCKVCPVENLPRWLASALCLDGI